MKESLIDVPVLLIFWARPWCFEKVFEQIRIARPNKLFLYQDGPRENRVDDVKNIEACRKIATQIDWACDVHQFYQEKNVGCDPSEFISIKWAFSQVDRCIVLEDDDVPSQSFFPYCEELLERYKNDSRINMVCGMNHLDEYTETPNSYFFSNTGAITGWASWKRVVDDWEEHSDVLDDPYSVMCLRKAYEDIHLSAELPGMFKNKMSGIAYYETIFGLSRFANARMCIVPSKNLIKNIGAGLNATHFASGIGYLPKGQRSIYLLECHELEFPLKHPKYIINDVHYSERMFDEYGMNRTFCQRIVVGILRRVYDLKQWLTKRSA